MYKKAFLSILMSIFLCLALTFCYATENPNTNNMMQNTENTIENGARNAGNMIKDAGNGIKNGAENLGNSTMNALDSTGNAMENGVNNAKNAVANTFDSNNDNNYTATRTSTEDTFMGMTSSTWSWLILGIAAIAIIGLVWYYSVQLNNSKHHDDNY